MDKALCLQSIIKYDSRKPNRRTKNGQTTERNIAKLPDENQPSLVVIIRKYLKSK